MTTPCVLVAGIGNFFLGDDAFGVEVVRRMSRRPLQNGMCLIDFGIRGMDLAYALLDDYNGAVLVDAAPRGGAPGTLYVIEPDLDNLEAGPVVEAHGMDPVNVLRLARNLGGPRPPIRIVGCEPATVDPVHDGQTVLSAPVEAAVDGAITLIEALVKEWLKGKAGSCTS